METISLIDGLILTVVSMLLVFIVLGSIGFLIDIIAKIVNRNEETVENDQAVTMQGVGNHLLSTDSLQENQENKFVAEMMALVLASEDEPNRKFEVIETKRIK